MAVLGQDQGSGYPTELDSALTMVDYPASNATVVTATYLNGLADAIVKIQEALGVNPAGSAQDLATRLSKMLTDAGVIQSGTDYPASPILGQMFYNTTSDAMAVYDGTQWQALGGTGGGGQATDHSLLSNLTSGDPHTQYVKQSGRTDPDGATTSYTTADLKVRKTDPRVRLRGPGGGGGGTNEIGFLYDYANNRLLFQQNVGGTWYTRFTFEMTDGSWLNSPVIQKPLLSDANNEYPWDVRGWVEAYIDRIYTAVSVNAFNITVFEPYVPPSPWG